MRISDWSSDVCSSDLHADQYHPGLLHPLWCVPAGADVCLAGDASLEALRRGRGCDGSGSASLPASRAVESARLYLWARTRRGNLSFGALDIRALPPLRLRSEEHTSELQSLMRISYAVFCLKKK